MFVWVEVMWFVTEYNTTESHNAWNNPQTSQPQDNKKKKQINSSTTESRVFRIMWSIENFHMQLNF